MTTNTHTDKIAGVAIDEMTDGYAVCLVWSGLDYDTDESGDCRPLDENYGVEDITDDTYEALRADCQAFIAGNTEDCLAYVRACETGGRIGYNGYDGTPWAWLGHDFALTRNHHGAGFWDRGLGALGDRLTAACRPYGEVSLYPIDGNLEVE